MVSMTTQVFSVSIESSTDSVTAGISREAISAIRTLEKALHWPLSIVVKEPFS